MKKVLILVGLVGAATYVFKSKKLKKYCECSAKTTEQTNTKLEQVVMSALKQT